MRRSQLFTAFGLQALVWGCSGIAVHASVEEHDARDDSTSSISDSGSAVSEDTKAESSTSAVPGDESLSDSYGAEDLEPDAPYRQDARADSSLDAGVDADDECRADSSDPVGRAQMVNVPGELPGEQVQFTWSQRGCAAPLSIDINSTCSGNPDVEITPTSKQICVDVSLATELVGTAEVCFVNTDVPRNMAFALVCRPRDSQGCPDSDERLTGNFCCVAYTAVEEAPGRLCVRTNHLGSFSLSTRLKDTDNDAVPDLIDNCPTVPNTFGQAEDADGDGVGDACDNCRTVYNPSQQDSNHNGIGDLCEAPTPVPDSGAGG